MTALKKKSAFRAKRALPYVALVGIVGVVLIVLVRAAGPLAAFEPESGALSGGAISQVVSGASGGQAVMFSALGTSSLFLNGMFPIGIYQQPAENFAMWKARGINTVTVVPGGSTVNTWATAADQAGLYQIRGLRTAGQLADSGSKWLLAVDQPDEPDGIYSQVPYSTLQADYSALKNLNSNLSVFINFVGGLNQFDVTGACSDKVYRSTCASGDSWYAKYMATADWISADSYPVNNGAPITDVGLMVDHLKRLSGAKPVFAFIESADYDSTAGGGAPTPDQLRAEMWNAIIHGARGLWFFPLRVTGSFAWDATPTAVVTEMTKQNATITALASVLQGEINPTGMSAGAISPIEVAWRNSNGGKYVFALNTSNAAKTAQTISLTGVNDGSVMVYGENRTVPVTGGRIIDTFAPYSVHIYQLP